MKYCDIHDTEMTQRTSKTKLDENGEPKSYWAHELGDGSLCFGNPPKKNGAWQRPDKPAFTPKAEEKVDWDAINRGKVKHGLVVAVLQKEGLKVFSDVEKQIIEDLADYIMAN